VWRRRAIVLARRTIVLARVAAAFWSTFVRSPADRRSTDRRSTDRRSTVAAATNRV
jgi:hypothetical protein